MSRPKNISWPIGFNDLLRYAFKQKRPAHRIKFYRLFLRDFLHKGTTRQASPQEIETALLADRQKKFDENWAFHIRLWSGMSFDKWKHENFQTRAKVAGYKSWSKKARKKRKIHLERKVKTPT